MRAVQSIVDYVVKYQNMFTTSFMFTKIMPSLLDKGILISDLVDSKIFGMRFDFDGWPSTHTEEDKLLRGFSDSLFTLRYKYKEVFPEEKFAAIDEDDP